MTFGIPWHWPLVIALALYLVSGAAVIAGRIGYERRRRVLERIELAMRSAASGQPEADMFAGVTAEQARRLPFEHSVSLRVNQAIATFLVAHLGVDAIAGPARGEKSRRVSRWKRVAALRLLALARPLEALPVLEGAADDGDEEVVAAAVGALGRIEHADAARCLVRVLDANRFPPSRVATFLDRFPLDVPDALRPLLSSATPTSRYWGAVLARRYPGLAWLTQALVALASDAEPTVRRAAIESLAALQARAATELAVGALNDPAWVVRAHAARALGELRASDHAARVAQLLTDRQWWVRQAAKDALVAIGNRAEPAVLAWLSHPDRFARNGAAEVLQDLGVLDRILAVEAQDSRDGAAGTLRLIRRAGEKELTEAALESLPADRRDDAAAILAALDEPDASV